MNLLFIAPKFFDYEKQIMKELTPYYDNIIFKTEVPFQSSTIYYAIKRFSKKLANKSLSDYNLQLISIVEKQNIDVIFIIRGVGLNEFFFRKIKVINKDLKIYHYQWDSFSIVPNAKLIADFADYNYSFDLADTSKDNRFKHLPLFSLLKNKMLNYPLKYDIVFIGTYHSNRVQISNVFKKYCAENNLIFFSYLYMPFFSYLRNRIQKNNINFYDIKTKQLSYRNYTKILSRAKIVVDSPYETQCGATMRTIEALSLFKKIISTNTCLINEKFYSKNNIYIIDKNINIDLNQFVNIEFDHSIDNEILDIKSWLKKINII